MKALGETPLEPTYEFNPRIEQNQELFNLPEKNERGNRNKKRRKNKRRIEEIPKELKVQFNQQLFSAKTHQKGRSEKLKDVPGAPMWIRYMSLEFVTDC